jgi:thiamine-phosphate pyrophosphorylase
VRAGVDWIQLRERELDGAAWLQWANELCDVARRAAAASHSRIKLLVNRRIDIALAIGADGVHLGFDAVSPPDAVALMGLRPPAARPTAERTHESDAAHGDRHRGHREEQQPAGAVEIGVSAHSPDEVAAAARSGATYAQLAPIWPPLSKAATRPALGVAALEVAARHGLPVLAQGGVRPDRCAAARRAGAAGVAVTGDILMAADPGAAAAALRAALDR